MQPSHDGPMQGGQPMQQQPMQTQQQMHTQQPMGTGTMQPMQPQPVVVTGGAVVATPVVVRQPLDPNNKNSLQIEFKYRSTLACGNNCGNVNGVGCCSYHCCAWVLLVLWLIGGIYSFVTTLTLSNTISNDYVTYDSCPYGSTSTDACCGEKSCSVICVYYPGYTCEQLLTYTGIAEFLAIAQAVAGFSGMIALAMYFQNLLFGPMGFCVVESILYIWLAIDLSNPGYALDIVIAVLIFFLFYKIYMMMKQVYEEAAGIKPKTLGAQ